MWCEVVAVADMHTGMRQYMTLYVPGYICFLEFSKILLSAPVYVCSSTYMFFQNFRKISVFFDENSWFLVLLAMFYVNDFLFLKILFRVPVYIRSSIYMFFGNFKNYL